MAAWHPVGGAAVARRWRSETKTLWLSRVAALKPVFSRFSSQHTPV